MAFTRFMRPRPPRPPRNLAAYKRQRAAYPEPPVPTPPGGAAGAIRRLLTRLVYVCPECQAELQPVQSTGRVHTPNKWLWMCRVAIGEQVLEGGVLRMPPGARHAMMRYYRAEDLALLERREEVPAAPDYEELELGARFYACA